MDTGGSCVPHLEWRCPIRVGIGALGIHALSPGRYAYVGSAASGIARRVNRHRLLAETMSGALRWHIDYLLANSW